MSYKLLKSMQKNTGQLLLPSYNLLFFLDIYVIGGLAQGMHAFERIRS